MSETDDTPSEEELEKQYADADGDNAGSPSASEKYTVDLNGKRYTLNEQARESIQQRAKGEYSENHLFECFWKVASAEDARDSDIHEEGDPILVIETEGPIVPWESLDQLELEMQDTSSFEGVDQGSSDVDEGGGMKTVKPGEVSDGASSDDTREKNRTHFGITPQDFEEVPSPDGEDPEKIPPKPEEYDEPTMVMWVPDNPDITHSWATGEAITPMYNWVEWNVQQYANQPRLTEGADDNHDHWESLLSSHGCEVVGELSPSQEPPKQSDDGESGSVKRKGKKSFEDGKYGGQNWNV